MSPVRRNRCRLPSGRPTDRGKRSMRAAFPPGYARAWRCGDRCPGRSRERARPSAPRRGRHRQSPSLRSAQVNVSHTSCTSAMKRRIPSWPEYTSGLKTRSDMSRRKSGAHSAASPSASPRFNASWARRTMSVPRGHRQTGSPTVARDASLCLRGITQVEPSPSPTGAVQRRPTRAWPTSETHRRDRFGHRAVVPRSITCGIAPDDEPARRSAVLLLDDISVDATALVVHKPALDGHRRELSGG